ncbi:uncharacterized protein LOC122574637 isoform X2 [Bombus pyrosoma]|uniref:uncharacterized protein LOC122574637 isoform X2 n=1 Tax=Bombus pyrosoma TaxID=396416 RepID=UPI001CB8B0C9|nr:uncharacterized protein LOC122574637 isoform X2 [Bombus pyrosoma]
MAKVNEVIDLKLGQKSLIGVEKSDFSRLQDPSGNPVYQQGVTSVCVTSRGFLEAEPVIAGAGGGGTLPHRGSFAPPSGFCSFVPPPPSTSSFSPPSSLLLSFELCSVTPHLSLLYQVARTPNCHKILELQLFDSEGSLKVLERCCEIRKDRMKVKRTPW